MYTYNKNYKPRKFEGAIWYDRSLRIWTCVQFDAQGSPMCGAGYGMSRTEAEDDCEYQQRIKGAGYV